MPDAEAEVIRNLMERIDQLETQVKCLEEGKIGRVTVDGGYAPSVQTGKAQNLKDKQIIEFLGDDAL